jgi:hypothetical protein
LRFPLPCREEPKLLFNLFFLGRRKRSQISRRVNNFLRREEGSGGRGAFIGKISAGDRGGSDSLTGVIGQEKEHSDWPGAEEWLC